MLSLAAYKVIHLLGIFLLLTGMGGVWALSMVGQVDRSSGTRRLLLVSHGIAVLLVLIAGFGMLARLGVMGAWPAWVWLKIGIWFVLGGLPALLLRTEKGAGIMLYLAPVLAAIAATAALFHIGAAS
jgi:hypothetical protein